jgi:recombination protein RecT
VADTRIVPLKQKVEDVRALLVQHKAQIAMALPRHLSADRMLRVAMTAVQRTPKLLDCTKGSLFAAIIQASQLGLEPDGVLGLAYLIPFRNNKKNVSEVQFLPGYRGLIDLARRSGNLSTIEARVVHDGDSFDYQYGLEPRLIHIPEKTPPDGRTIKFVYAIGKLKDGGAQFEVMTSAEIDAIRSNSRAANDGPWVEHWPEMAKKTVLRRLCKLLPVSIELQRAVALDELVEAGLPQELETLDEVPALDSAAPPSSLDALAAATKTAAPAEPPS